MRKVAKTINDWVNAAIREKRVPENTDQAHLATVVVAASVAYRLPLPTNSVRRPEEWYLQQCLVGVEDAVGKLNEYLILNVNELDKLTRSIWLMRYRILHTPFSEHALQALLCSLEAADYEVAPVYRQWITEFGKGPSQTLMIRVSEALNEANVLPVEFDDE
jgi:hypothetical protein